MTDKLHRVSEIAASGLKDDPELYLSVKREIEVHLQESTERLENAGQDHDKAVETALEKFGSPAETADAIFKTNKKRLKLRARLRFLLISLMPLAALVMMVFSILPEWKNLQITREMFYSVYKCRDKAASLAGIDLKKLTKEQLLLLDNNWAELHKMFPDNKAYFANYFMISNKTWPWTNGYTIKRPPITPRWLKKARKIDPGNALYDYMAAQELLYQGSKSRRTFSAGAICDPIKLMEALPYYIAGLRQQFYRNYRDEIIKQRIKLNPDTQTPYTRAWTSYIRCAYLYDYELFDYLEQAIPMWGETLIKAKRFKEAEQVLDSWKRLIWQNLKPETDSNKYSSCMRMLKTLNKKLPPLYQKLGKPEKAAETQKQLNKILASWTKRLDKKSPDKIATKEVFLKHAPHILHYLGSWLLPGEYSLEELNPGRIKEYIHADRILLFTVQILLACLMTGCTLCWLTARFRLKKNLQPVLFIPNGKTFLKLLFAGIVLPLILWRLLILIQPGGRDYALTYCSINFLAQGLFLITGMTLWPFFLMRYYIAARAKELGIPAVVDKRFLIIIPILAFIIAVLACIPWYLWINIDMMHCLDMHLMPKEHRLYPELYIIEWWHLALPVGIIAVLFILAVPAGLFRVWHNPQSLFVKGVAAAAMLMISAIILIFTVFLANGYFYWQECRYMKLEKHISASGNTLYRDRIAKKGRSQILKLLNGIEKPLISIKTNYFFIDDESFCSAVESSPFSVIKESLKNGANVNAVNSDGHSALMLACRYRDAKIVKLLLDNSADINIFCPSMKFRSHKVRFTNKLAGVNALMVASYYNPDPELIKLLIKHGANVNSKALKGYSRQGNHSWLSYKMTPLMFACWNNNEQVINTLLDNGANIWDKNAWGKDVLYYLGKNPKIYGNKIKNRIQAIRRKKKH